MGARRGDQIWLVGGLLTIVALVAASWFLVISPKFDQSDNVRGEVATAEIQLVRLNKEVAELAALAKQQGSYEARLKAGRIALPNADKMAAFLRELQSSETGVTVVVSSLNIATLTKTDAVPGTVDLPVTLTATGRPANLSRFLKRLQNEQARAVLISSISLTPGSTTAGSASTDMTASINLKAFCLEQATATKTDNCKVD